MKQMTTFSKKIIFFIIFAIFISNDVVNAVWVQMESNSISNLQEIWGSAVNNIYSVGTHVEDNVVISSILHYNGKSWTEKDIGIQAIFRDIWGASDNNIYAVGEDPYGNEIFYYDGSSWSPAYAGNRRYVLTEIWGTSSTNIFAIGLQGIILHYDGDTWSEMNSGTISNLTGIWGSSGNNIFVVGDNNTILRYDGNSWSEMDTGVKENEWAVILTGVWGTSETNIFAVGTEMFYYDGTIWSMVEKDIFLFLRDIWGNSGNDIFAVGDEGVILHHDGVEWSEMDSGISTNLNGVWGTSGNNIFAVGDNGMILHYDGSDTPTTIITTTTTSVPELSTTTTSSDGENCPLENIYGENSTGIELLRYLRDNVLSKSPAGQEIIRLYYEWNPMIVKMMGEDEAFKKEVKEMIDGILSLIRGEGE